MKNKSSMNILLKMTVLIVIVLVLHVVLVLGVFIKAFLKLWKQTVKRRAWDIYEEEEEMLFE